MYKQDAFATTLYKHIRMLLLLRMIRHLGFLGTNMIEGQIISDLQIVYL